MNYKQKETFANKAWLIQKKKLYWKNDYRTS
jgi:hypothetical protein